MLVLDHAQSARSAEAIDSVAIVEECFRLNDGRHIRQPDPPTWGLGVPEFDTVMRFKGCFIDTVPVCGFRLTCLTRDPAADELAMRWVLLVDPQTGRPLGLVDEHALYQRRVAAAVAVGLRAVAGGELTTIGVIGAGRLARRTLSVLAALFPAARMFLASRTHGRAVELAAALADRVAVEVLSGAQAVMERCEAVVTATSASAPVVEAQWARAGQVLCTLGRNELPDEIYMHASAVVASDRVISTHADDIQELMRRAAIDRASFFTADVGELLRGEATLFRQRSDGIVVYRSDGFVAQDVMLAHAVWAQHQQIGA